MQIKGLAVDDEEIILLYFERLLKGWNYQVETTSSPQEALKRIKRNDYDFVLLDIKMPDINGEQLYNMIAELKPPLVSRIIIITGDIMNKTTVSFLNKTESPILTKPIDTDKLKETIDKIISNQ